MRCCVCGKALAGEPAMVDRATGEAFCYGCRSYYQQPRTERPRALGLDTHSGAPLWRKGVIVILRGVTGLSVLLACVMILALLAGLTEGRRPPTPEDLKQMMAVVGSCVLVAAGASGMLWKMTKKR